MQAVVSSGELHECLSFFSIRDTSVRGCLLKGSLTFLTLSVLPDWVKQS